MEDYAQTERCIPCENIENIDATSNIQNCYYCIKEGCGCTNDQRYLDSLVTQITEEVFKKIGF